MCYIMSNIIYISLQRYRFWLIMDDTYSFVRLNILSIILMHEFMAYCGIVIHYDHSLCCLLLDFKNKIFSHVFIKWVVTCLLVHPLLWWIEDLFIGFEQPWTFLCRIITHKSSWNRILEFETVSRVSFLAHECAWLCACNWSLTWTLEHCCAQSCCVVRSRCAQS